ncbi:lebercilin isoform X1 [Epinephelus lanceolatus]
MSICSQSDNMESENIADPYEDNQDRSRQSHRSTKKDSRASSSQKHKKKFRDKIHDEGEKEGCADSRSKTRTWRSDPDRDQISDGERRRSSGSFYSEDYENDSPSEGSLTPYSQSRTPSPTLHRGVRAKRISNSPFYKTGGVGRRGVSRPQRLGGQPLTQQHRKGVHSQSKESTPPKDLDLVTKRMLSARLLKINELRNSLAELQQRTDELQKENRILRQLQVRQEKALQRYDDTESEISQLLARHNNETHVLRERLRRTQERERVAERQMKDSEEQLQRSRATIARLKKLVDQRELGARDELSRRLEEEKTRAQEAERKIKELERSMELSNSSYQRQLAAERKKTISAQEEIRTLQEELERLTNKLKEKERELDARNIYANRMMKPPIRKDVDSGMKRKVPSRSSTKAVQAKDRASSLDFPTPPPAITDANDYTEQTPDEYLSLKQELDSADRCAETEDRHQKWEQQKMRDREKEKELVKEKEREQEKEEKRQINQELNALEEKAKTLRDGWEKKKEEEDRKKTSPLFDREEENNRKRGHVQEEVERWNQEVLANQQAAAEARRKKDQLLAKMREIDHQDHRAQDAIFSESSPSESNKAASNHYSPHPPEQRNHNSSIFNLTESEDSASLRTGAGSRDGERRRSGMEGGAAITGIGRRGLRPQISNDDLAFGSYAPSFGHSASRGSSGFPPPPPPPKADRDSALEAIGIFSLRGTETEKEKETERAGKDRKSSLMQQLFGAVATPASDSVSTSNKMEVLNSPPTTNGVRSRRDGLLSFNSGSNTPPASSLNTVHTADSRPAVRAITSFDDDIEELTL